MKFLNVFTVLSAAVLASAAPVTNIDKRAIFSQSTFNELSISGGTAGGAAKAALAKLGPLPADLTTVEQSDIDFLDSVNKICNEAEKQAFNPAIDAASGAAADALQRGKIQNKVLKLTATVLKLQIQQAQGKTGLETKLAQEQKKLTNNINQDEAAAGQPATSLAFNAST